MECVALGSPLLPPLHLHVALVGEEGDVLCGQTDTKSVDKKTVYALNFHTKTSPFIHACICSHTSPRILLTVSTSTIQWYQT